MHNHLMDWCSYVRKIALLSATNEGDVTHTNMQYYCLMEETSLIYTNMQLSNEGDITHTNMWLSNEGDISHTNMRLSNEGDATHTNMQYYCLMGVMSPIQTANCKLEFH